MVVRMGDDFNYNTANSYTPADLLQGPILVWPEGRATPTMLKTYGKSAKYWSKEVHLVGNVPVEVRIFEPEYEDRQELWKADLSPFLPQEAVAEVVADRLA